MNSRNKTVLINRSSQSSRRIHVILLMLIGAFAVLSFRLWTIQVFQHDDYVKKAEVNYIRRVPIKSTRGMILDRNGKVLAHDVSFCDVWVPIINKRGKRVVTDPMRETLGKLSDILEVPYERLEKNYLTAQRDFYYKHERVRIYERAPWDKMVALKERVIEFSGDAMIFLESTHTRNYPRQDLAAHVLGYTSEIDKPELASPWYADRGYQRGDWIGKVGIEKQYEEFLRGKDGVQLITVDRDEIQRDSPTVDQEAEPGKNVMLTLDYELQLAAEQALGASRGVIIVADPRDNSILAMASNPRYNPNHVNRDLSKYRVDNSFPLLHRAVVGLYEPGSIIKIFEMIPLLEEMHLEPAHTEYCPGFFTLPNYGVPWRCHKKEGHGTIDMNIAITKSCNVYFYRTIPKLGITRLAEWMNMFGFGKNTNVDLPNELTKPYPTPKTEAGWQGGFIINLAIGQGPFRVTPLQISTAICAIANRGKFYRPHLLEKVLESGERSPGADAVFELQPEVNGDLSSISDETWDRVHHSMQMVVDHESGTGRRIKDPSFPIAGKTGTAQNSSPDTHAWFTCFGPVHDPQIAVTVIIENGGHGGETASPLAGEIIQLYKEKYSMIARSEPAVKIQERLPKTDEPLNEG